ncbi:biotin--[acetyl-CoA-carboxylase] ligase [Atopococcus tabaci]|uniref:biotin--[acetyl-CoA-carboxylase] ligase n=1 Tax=Atopococcus tabaci TaxID=269774 RepID=UPI002409B91C|nr:biotin--[acetyl-CoA-carboxylase] ligase [Atopococcus tabaci]
MTKKEQNRESTVSLSKEQIIEKLTTTVIGRNLSLFDSVESTNLVAKEHIQRELVDGEVLLALEQTAGKGRLGREWTSSKGKALTMSIVLKPLVEKPYLLTQLTAAALAAALSPLADFGIKWPNDLLLNNKKVAGILTETVYSGSTLEAVIIGVGINVNQDASDFPDSILTKASSLKMELGSPLDPNAIAAAFLNSFEVMYQQYLQTKDPSLFLEICREKSLIIGKTVWIVNGKQKKKARVKDIGTDGELKIIDDMTGMEEALYGGEISIRGIDGYI